MEGLNITNHPSYAFSQSTAQMACDNFVPSAGNNCNYESIWTAMYGISQTVTSSPATVLLQGNTAGCETARSTPASNSGPPASGYPGCITSTQGINRQFQFALKLTF